MSTDLVAALSFIIISVFTPGPNNISSAAMSVLHGYRRTLNYLFGMSGGFLIVITICGVVSAAMLNLLPALESVLRYVGAAYMLYLAYGILKASYTFDAETVKPMGFTNGLLLQFLNPKLIVFGLTLFSTFFAGFATLPLQLLIAVIGLTLASFVSTSLWALFGTIIKQYLRSPRAKLVLNICLCLLLVFSALELARIV